MNTSTIPYSYLQLFRGWIQFQGIDLVVVEQTAVAEAAEVTFVAAAAFEVTYWAAAAAAAVAVVVAFVVALHTVADEPFASAAFVVAVAAYHYSPSWEEVDSLFQVWVEDCH